MKSKMPKYDKKDEAKLQAAFGKSELTIRRWIEADDPVLTSEKAVAALKTHNFDKGVVYKVEGKKMLCILMDTDIAVLAKVIPHRDDAGYKTKYDGLLVYGGDIRFTAIARVENLCYIPFEK